MNAETNDDPRALRQKLRDLTERTLSPAGRYAHVLLLLAAAAAGVLVLALLLTEPSLPLRTQTAFGTMLAIAGAWVGYSAWVLLHRRPLMHAHRVVAACLATAFSGLFAVATLTAAAMTGAQAAALAGGVGVVMLGAAIGLLVHAHRRRRALLARRDELMRALGDG